MLTENINMITAINNALDLSMEENEAVVLLGQDIAENGGVFRATDGLFEKYGGDRVMNTPLAESGIIGTSLGLSINGFNPVAEIQFMGFSFKAMDQLVAQVARVRYRSQGSYFAPLVIRTPYGGGVKTPELHSDSLEALFAHSPGLRVVVPSNPYDAKGMLIAAIKSEDPVMFLEPMKLYRSKRMEVPRDAYTVDLNKANVIQEGEDVTIITWGAMVDKVQNAIKKYENSNVSIEVIDLRSINPIDEQTIINSVEKTSRVIVVHEAVKSFGVGAEITSIINEKALFSLASPIIRVAGYNTPYPTANIEEEWLPTDEKINKAVEEVMQY